MKLSELEAKIEAILFTMGEAVELERIAAATEQDEDTCRKVIRSMMDNYAAEDRGIQIIELDGAFQMCTKADMYEAIVRIAHVPKKHVRGVKSDHSVNKLVEYNLVCEAGRLDAPGRPILFATTEEFLRNFGIESLDDLPVVNPEKIEDFKLEAEEEVQLELDI